VSAHFKLETNETEYLCPPLSLSLSIYIYIYTYIKTYMSAICGCRATTHSRKGNCQYYFPLVNSSNVKKKSRWVGREEEAIYLRCPDHVWVPKTSYTAPTSTPNFMFQQLCMQFNLAWLWHRATTYTLVLSYLVTTYVRPSVQFSPGAPEETCVEFPELAVDSAALEPGALSQRADSLTLVLRWRPVPIRSRYAPDWLWRPHNLLSNGYWG
jgi:hypothetical protein